MYMLGLANGSEKSTQTVLTDAFFTNKRRKS
jgi:hypothetical protein